MVLASPSLSLEWEKVIWSSPVEKSSWTLVEILAGGREGERVGRTGSSPWRRLPPIGVPLPAAREAPSSGRAELS